MEASRRAAREQNVQIPLGDLVLRGDLVVPARPAGVVVFAHGSGSSRGSPRNRFVASALNEAGLATLLFDLLTAAEEGDRQNVFDVELLADRLAGATRWVRARPDLEGLDVGFFGASTGAAAALSASTKLDRPVAAIVSRGGRPDLAGRCLAAVSSPTLLIVGGHDETVLRLNREAAERLRCEKSLAVVPGAGHLFEEPGALEHVVVLARHWFLVHLAGVRTPAGSELAIEKWVRHRAPR
jgi:putative phosphoribosyl transferase